MTTHYRRLILVLLAAACLAPTPGDIGGCGQAPQELDAERFFETKKSIDCDRCLECGLEAQSCTRACAAQTRVEGAFPADCLPLVHDGEVCLRALIYASCDEYAEYMDDRAPRVPGECDFCPEYAR